eukprot:EG_transcript_6973
MCLAWAVGGLNGKWCSARRQTHLLGQQQTDDHNSVRIRTAPKHGEFHRFWLKNANPAEFGLFGFFPHRVSAPSPPLGRSNQSFFPATIFQLARRTPGGALREPPEGVLPASSSQPGY